MTDCNALLSRIFSLRMERDDWHAVADSRSAEINRLMNELAAAKAVIENIVVSEVEPLKALLWECLNAWTGDGPPIELDSIRAALGDEPADPRPGHKPE